MRTIDHLRITSIALCEPLGDQIWYDVTNGVRARLSDPLLLDDGLVTLDARIPLASNALMDNTEKMLRCRFHGRNGKAHFRLAEPKDHIISAEYFVEQTLVIAQKIEEALQALSQPLTGVAWTMRGAEDLLEILDAVRDGRMDSTAFSSRIGQADYAPGTPGHHHLFSRNAHILVEQFRTSLLRAFANSDCMMEQARLIIDNKDGRHYPPLSEGEELNHASMAAERLHGAFVDGVGSVATALDLLYRVFIFLVREPFGSADLPGKLYFPYHEVGKPYNPYPRNAGPEATDLGSDALQYALPNAPERNFFALRSMRNDLTHNMTSGHIQPNCWIGRGTGQVNGVPIMYVIANAPDIDHDGKQVKHHYIERFYTQQRDAAAIYRDLIEELVLTTEHTLQWLANRLEQRVARGH